MNVSGIHYWRPKVDDLSHAGWSGAGIITLVMTDKLDPIDARSSPARESPASPACS